MKFKKEFGSEAVRDLIREAQAVAATVPNETVRDPWPDDRLLVARTDEKTGQQDK
ncbi:MAG TPA: hypothetical protein VK932_23005 [Kofleriaceae bacterium]|nr:hypothetical protein [Kofleriaceae bacterium]